jgi:fucose permease
VSVSLAYLAFIGLGVRGGLLGVSWPSMQADFNVPLDALGQLIAPFSLGFLLASFINSRALVRWDLGLVLAAGFACIAISLLGTALTPAWWLLLVLTLPGGLGAGLIVAALNVFVAHRLGAREMNWLHGCWGVGVTISPIALSAAITSGISWRWGFGVVGVLLAGLCAMYLMSRHVWPSRAEVTRHKPGESTSQVASMWRTLRLPVAWLSLLLFIFYTGIELGLGQWAFQLLIGTRGLGIVEAGAAVSVYWVGLTLGRLFSGAVVSVLGVGRMLFICLVGVLVGLGLLWLPAGTMLAFAALVLLGMFLAPVYPSLMSVIPDHFGSADTANVIGFSQAAAVVGGAGIPAALGFLAQAFGLEVIVPTRMIAAILQLACYVAWSIPSRARSAARASRNGRSR